MKHISDAAMARILQSAFLEFTSFVLTKAIIQYANTLSTFGLSTAILDHEGFQRYKAMIDLAARRSARARIAAAVRRRANAAKRAITTDGGNSDNCGDDSNGGGKAVTTSGATDCLPVAASVQQQPSGNRPCGPNNPQPYIINSEPKNILRPTLSS